MHRNPGLSSKSIEALQFAEQLLNDLYYIPPRIVRVELARRITEISVEIVARLACEEARQ